MVQDLTTIVMRQITSPSGVCGEWNGQKSEILRFTLAVQDGDEIFTYTYEVHRQGDKLRRVCIATEVGAQEYLPVHNPKDFQQSIWDELF